jgi:hypothetical protein
MYILILGLPDEIVRLWGSSYLSVDIAKAGPKSAPLVAELDVIAFSFK